MYGERCIRVRQTQTLGPARRFLVQSHSNVYSHLYTVWYCSTLHDDYSINKNNYSFICCPWYKSHEEWFNNNTYVMRKKERKKEKPNNGAFTNREK